MDFDDAEWVLTDGADYGSGDDGDAGWVMADGGVISGVFFQAAGRPAYASFDHPIPDPTLAFLPPSVSVRAASNGLLCLRGPWSTYYVCNPATARCAAVPRPPRHHHGRDPALAIVFDPDEDSRPGYLLVFALAAAGASPDAYRFETFSSAAGVWRASAATCSTGGRLVPSSGVSSGGVAYWRTTEGAVVAYDPEIDAAKIVLAPARCGEAAARWVLGEAGGRLCCACVTDKVMEVHALGPSDQWVRLASFGVAAIGEEKGAAAEEWEVGGSVIVCREPPWPLRFQSASLEVVLWVDGRVVGMDLESRRVRKIAFDAPAPGCFADYVSHINTLAPVLHQDMAH